MNNLARKSGLPSGDASRTGSGGSTGRAPLRVTRPVTVQAVGICKSYRNGQVEVPVLRGVDITIFDREFVAVVGSSGSGKSTLLHLLGTLDRPDKGEICIHQQNVNSLRTAERDRLRNMEIGLIFQFYHLLPELTALENVLLPHMIRCGIFRYLRERRQLRQRAEELLDRVGLAHRLHHRPRQLSGGEMQRAAIARALVARPGLLLADEPTGNLDRQNSDEVLSILMKLRSEENLTIVMVTHDNEIAQKADRKIQLVEGRISA